MMEDLGEGEKADAKLEEIKAAMAEQGFAFSRPVGSRSEGLTLVFDRKGVRTDIHFFYRNDETNEFYINILDGPTSYKNVYTQFEVRPAEAFGVLVAVPYPAQEYLATTYGDFMRKRTSERGTGEGTAGWNLESPLNANVTRRSLQSCDAYKAYGQKYFCICKFYGCIYGSHSRRDFYGGMYKCITDMYSKFDRCYYEGKERGPCYKDAYTKFYTCYYDFIKNFYSKIQGCYNCLGNCLGRRDSSCPPPSPPPSPSSPTATAAAEEEEKEEEEEDKAEEEKEKEDGEKEEDTATTAAAVVLVLGGAGAVAAASAVSSPPSAPSPAAPPVDVQSAFGAFDAAVKSLGGEAGAAAAKLEASLGLNGTPLDGILQRQLEGAFEGKLEDKLKGKLKGMVEGKMASTTAKLSVDLHYSTYADLTATKRGRRDFVKGMETDLTKLIGKSVKVVSITKDKNCTMSNEVKELIKTGKLPGLDPADKTAVIVKLSIRGKEDKKLFESKNGKKQKITLQTVAKDKELQKLGIAPSVWISGHPGFFDIEVHTYSLPDYEDLLAGPEAFVQKAVTSTSPHVFIQTRKVVRTGQL